MVLFDQLVNAHIATGATGLVSLWVPILARKGSVNHKFWGKVFLYSMLATGTIAVGISICSLIAPLETHPFSDDAEMIRGLFGWMMMYLGILTVALAYQSFLAVWARRDDSVRGSKLNLALQIAMGVSALNCLIYGLSIGQIIMVGVSAPGLAASVLNIMYLREARPIHNEWLVQHFRCGIGAGISVYTAFLAFGAVNSFPSFAFNPWLWALPTVLGVGYMIHQQLIVFRQRVRMGLVNEMPVGKYAAALLMPDIATQAAADRLKRS